MATNLKITTAITTKDGNVYWGEELWLQQHGIEYHKNIGSKHSCTVAYNIAIERFLREDKGNEWLVLLNNDVGLNDAALGLWKMWGDLLYCGAPSETGRGHFGDGDLWSGCMRVSRSLLEKMRALRHPPWFHRPANSIETELFGCDCQYFRDGARLVGIESKMVTTVEHLVRVFAGYDESGCPTFRPLGVDREKRNAP